MDIKDIKRIVDLMTRNDLTEFSLDDNGFKLELKRGSSEIPQYMQAAPMAVAAPVAMAAPAHATCAPAAAPAPVVEGEEITSPIVGTFYGSPSPESPAFVKVGDTVTEDTVVCIIEAMKVMNEIKAEVSGVVKKMLVEDGAPVQYGQALFILEV